MKKMFVIAMLIISINTYAQENDRYKCVDLGLSVKWATCNVGASCPEEYGGYYAWGETEEKEDYSWGTYKWCNGNTMTKYCTNYDFGTIDNKTTLDLNDDVAHIKWGDNWRMPTIYELIELYDECEWVWTTINDVKGYRVVGPNGNSIFLPAAGYRVGTRYCNLGHAGFYWPSTLGSLNCTFACYLSLNSTKEDWGGLCHRFYGHTVRPVCD